MTRRRGARPALRLVSLLASFTLLFVAVAAKLVVLQVVQAQPLEKLGSRQRVHATSLPARRGSIFDRDMQPLAVSADARAIYANPRFITDPALVASQLGPMLGIDVGDLTARLSRKTGFVYVARQVPPAVADEILALRLPFVGALKETRRLYPADTTAGQILGFVGLDGSGLAGLEQRYDEMLRGTPGEQIVEQDPSGRPIPQGRNSIVEPVAGQGLELTIDRDLQFYAEAALARGAIEHHAKDGTALVLDPRTGDVLAMASWPPMSPSAFSDASPFERRNRVVTDSYEPGSVNKVITASAAIEAGIATPSTKIKVPYAYRVANKMFHDFHSHPTEIMTYAEALAESSNVATIKIAKRLGRKRLDRALRAFGFGHPTGVGFPGEASGILLPLDDWYPTSMGTIPIGQGIAVTPLQIALAYATIANDGVQVQPRLVRGIVADDGTVKPATAPHARRVVSAYTAAQVRAMLLAVVERGTGARSQIPGYLVAGKTGTARVPLVGRRGYSGNIITTFVAMAPADDARLVVLVSLDNPSPRLAALTAAPIEKQIMQYALTHLGIAPTANLPDHRRLDTLRARALPAPKPSVSPEPSLAPDERKKQAKRP